MTDLQNMELGGGTQKTLWQLCQLVAVEIPGEVKDDRSVKLCIMQRPDWQVEVPLPKNTAHQLQCNARHY